MINEPVDTVNNLPGAFLPQVLLHLLPLVLTNFVISTLSLKYLAQIQKENSGIFLKDQLSAGHMEKHFMDISCNGLKSFAWKTQKAVLQFLIS